jgi:hypothetical protein
MRGQEKCRRSQHISRRRGGRSDNSHATTPALRATPPVQEGPLLLFKLTDYRNAEPSTVV